MEQWSDGVERINTPKLQYSITADRSFLHRQPLRFLDDGHVLVHRIKGRSEALHFIKMHSGECAYRRLFRQNEGLEGHESPGKERPHSGECAYSVVSIFTW